MQPTRSTRSSNWFRLAHPKLTYRLKFSDRSFVMLHLLFGTNDPPPFVPSPHKQLVSTQCHSHHLPYLMSNFLSILIYLFTLSFPLLAPSIPSLSTFSTSHCQFLFNAVECSRIYQRQLVSGHYNVWC